MFNKRNDTFSVIYLMFCGNFQDPENSHILFITAALFCFLFHTNESRILKTHHILLKYVNNTITIIVQGEKKRHSTETDFVPF